MQATMLYGARDIRFEDRPDPQIVKPTDAVVRIEAHRELRRRFCWSYAAIGIPAICS